MDERTARQGHHRELPLLEPDRTISSIRYVDSKYVTQGQPTHHDFGALYASIKNNGKSLGQLIEKYIGKTGRRLFLLFSWLFCCIVIAAFTSMVAGTFKFTTAEAGGIDVAKSYAGGVAGTISILFTFVAIAFGWARRRLGLSGWREILVAIVAIVAMFAVGMHQQVIPQIDREKTISIDRLLSTSSGKYPAPAVL